MPDRRGLHAVRTNPTHPPPDAELHVALADVLQKFLMSNPIRVRTTLPIVHGGTTVAIFVWWDRVTQAE